MIKYNNSNINDWNFGEDNIIKVYRNNAVCYYKVTSDTPTPVQEPCFAVVDDISQYSDTEFEDVFNLADEKWYKLNNLDNYEQYGIYGEGRNITYYDGKLTVDDGYEYMYSGNTWNNMGEVSGSSRLPQGYTEVEYIENKNMAYINTGFKPNQDTRMHMNMQMVTQTSGGRYISAGGAWNTTNTIAFDYESSTLHVKYAMVGGWITYNSVTMDYDPHEYDFNKNEFYVDGTLVGSTSYTAFQCSYNLAIFAFLNNGTQGSSGEQLQGKMYWFKLYDDGTLIRDFVPCKRDSDSKYGAYDLVNDVFYPSANASYAFTGGSETSSGTTYPVYYDEIQDPPDNLVFTSMEEAEEYECPWVGMKATIDGDKYVFSGDSTSGYEWVYNPSRLPVGYTEVEYVQNTGTSYFNTNFVPNQDTRVLCEMQMTANTNYGRLWGAGAWNASKGIMIDYTSASFEIKWFGKTSWNTYSSFKRDFVKHTYDYNKNYVYIDGTLVGSNTYTTMTSSDPIGIFTYIGSGRPSSSSYWGQEHYKGKMFTFQVYDNGILVRDLVPCIRDNDNEVGAYDIVNDVFYTVPTGYTTDKLVAGQPV